MCCSQKPLLRASLLPDQFKVELLPKAETEFGLREVNAQVAFIKDASGKVTRAKFGPTQPNLPWCMFQNL